ncbi:DUF998 domain-containing protein [Umezawaea tangerina]|uniref:DUF998 domain-containing protein n=1 Tax=Umezawaea tangerina TaxID=84725 RepID=A0A2T0SQY6_9PSEU|nr:DUF998 domain-containing protein [Umezawaea tangerina]PRY35818.1 hypothetical protein CLV43_113245 [Umezawaea tangerina]
MNQQDSLVHSYLFLRRAIGFVGVLLPFVVVVGSLLAGDGLLDSISGYYYSPMRNVFVGAMCAVGVFLLSYRGYDRLDNTTATVAGFAAIGVGLFPTTPEGGHTPLQGVVGVLHLVFAAFFFLPLAYFCLVLFRKSDKSRPTVRKVQRNRVYAVSGAVILGCLALIVVVNLFPDTGLHPALWLESAAILAFGFAWLTKGEAILGDLAPTPV